MTFKVEETWILSKKYPCRLDYADLKYDHHGWIDVRICLPADCDLVTVKTARGIQLNAWIIGDRWEGIRMKRVDIVTAWKREMEPM